MQLPERFVTRLTDQLGAEEATRLITALEGVPPTSIRLNPLHQGQEALLEGLGVERPIGWSGAGYYLAERPSFTLDPAFHSGAY